MNNKKSVDVGEPSNLNARWCRSAEVHFNGFENTPTRRGTSNNLKSLSTFSCCGPSNDWFLAIFPGGYALSADADDEEFGESSDGMVGLALYYYNIARTEDINLDIYFSVRNDAGKEIVHVTRPRTKWGTNSDVLGLANFAKRSTLLNCLVDGTLTVEIRMRKSQTRHLEHAYIPSNPFSKNMLQLFMEEESADVTFQVGGKQGVANPNKVAKTAPTNFYAHRLILRKSASSMAEMCGEGGVEGMTVVPINDIKPEIFKQVLYFVYGGAVPEEFLETNAREIIDASDKLGVTSLKLQAEASFVKATTISIDNLMENLLYADSKNCALLKEAVIDFVVDNGMEVLDKVRLEDVPAGMFRDLLTAVARKEGSKSNTGGDEGKLSTLRVSELRMKLDEKELDVDGSREAMIATLKDYDRDNSPL